jgi:hypothetical protein
MSLNPFNINKFYLIKIKSIFINHSIIFLQLKFIASNIKKPSINLFLILKS